MHMAQQLWKIHLYHLRDNGYNCKVRQNMAHPERQALRIQSYLDPRICVTYICVRMCM